MPESLKIR